jgi:ATP-dependent helicase/nuclease subunit A
MSDHKQRQRALNPTQSFIVQAPAGSGKTELLIQRFLNLLGHVKAPEEILAITFTKKAAAEMRDRILLALEDATLEFAPESPHKQITRHLALNALKQNALHGWKLLENPNRLRIQTIDSFNAWLARQLPTLSYFGASPDIVNNPDSLYHEAIQEFILHLEENTEWSQAIETLLMHLDNDLNKVEQLLMRMLQKRDQWLSHIMLNANDPQLRKKLEINLKSILLDTLQCLHHQFSLHTDHEFIALVKFAANNLMTEKPGSPITHCKDLTALPGHTINDKTLWLGLTKLLLTEKFEWRKRLDKSVGFPPASSSINPDEKARLKASQLKMGQLIEKLSTKNELKHALIALALAPESTYPDNQWKILASLHDVLKIVVAQLKLIFQQHGKIDYIENAHAALMALGTDQYPTDLALALDYKLQHNTFYSMNFKTLPTVNFA